MKSVGVRFRISSAVAYRESQTVQGSGPMGNLTPNSVMQVTLVYQPASVAPSPIQLYASSQPTGDLPPYLFARAPNPTVVNWP